MAKRVRYFLTFARVWKRMSYEYSPKMLFAFADTPQKSYFGKKQEFYTKSNDKYLAVKMDI